MTPKRMIVTSLCGCIEIEVHDYERLRPGVLSAIVAEHYRKAPLCLAKATSDPVWKGRVAT